MKNPQILIVGSDELLREEVRAALRGIKKWKPVLHVAHDVRQGVEAARSRRPELIVFELRGGGASLTEFADEVSNGSPESVVVATYRAEDFDDDASESESDGEGDAEGAAAEPAPAPSPGQPQAPYAPDFPALGGASEPRAPLAVRRPAVRPCHNSVSLEQCG